MTSTVRAAFGGEPSDDDGRPSSIKVLDDGPNWTGRPSSRLLRHEPSADDSRVVSGWESQVDRSDEGNWHPRRSDGPARSTHLRVTFRKVTIHTH